MTFNVLLDSLSKEGMIAEAEELLGLMIQRGEEPDEIFLQYIDGWLLFAGPNGVSSETH